MNRSVPNHTYDSGGASDGAPDGVPDAESRARMLQNEKLAAIGQIAAGVAHEINNPIGYLGSNLNALQDYMRSLLRLIDQQQALLVDSDKDVNQRTEVILALTREAELDHIRDDLPALMRESLEGIERIRRTVKDMKDFSRMDDMAFEWVDIHDTLRSSLNIAHHELKQTADVELTFGTLPKVRCVSSQLSQVFVNILINAAQAMSGHGKVLIASRQYGEWVEIDIADNGPGIPEDVRQRIFEPFYSTKPAGTGTGLGLSISANIISDHRGVLAVDTEPGKGTCFTIKLPIEGRDSDAGQ